jgi:hypothetical protein
VTKLRTIPPVQFSARADINREAMNWAQSNNDVLERWANGSIDGSNIVSGSVPLTDLASDAWSSFTPTWTSTGTNPALNNGTLTGRTQSVGKTCFGHIDLAIGSTTTFGTGNYLFGLPRTSQGVQWNTVGSAFDSSAGSLYALIARFNTTTTCTCWTMAAPAVLISATVPFTWATGDTLYIDFFYEAA